MAALTRREAEERRDAVKKFFLENPRATGDEAQRALTSGQLTGGKKGPPMGIGMLYRIQREAQKELRVRAAHPPRSVPIAGTPAPPLSEDTVEGLRRRAREIQAALAAYPDGIMEIRITAEGARIVRKPQEEDL